MHNGLTTHREDLFDEERQPSSAPKHTPRCRHCSLRLIPAIGGTEGWYHVSSGNRRCDGVVEGGTQAHSTLGEPGWADGPFSRSSAAGSSWPQGKPELAASVPEEVVERLEELVPQVTTGELLVTVVACVSWEGTVAVFFGRTDTHYVTFAVDQRCAADLVQQLHELPEVLALVESWQLLQQRSLTAWQPELTTD